MKKKTSITLSEEAKALLELLSQKQGISQSAYLEITIREKARQAKIKEPKLLQP